jgi:hypothetical protein
MRENLLLCSSHLPLGVPNWSVNTAPSTSFLVPLPGRKRISARGVSHFQLFYFVIILLSFFTLFLFASFYQKYKKNSSFYSWYFVALFLVHYVDP